MKKRHIQKLLLLSFVLLLAFNFPILLLFNSAESVLGIPVILFYVFILWLISALISLIIFKKFNE
ncbi:hypothetical protein G4D82_06445 [Flavobacterium sp. CYK-4]|uniref:hypothetical protein n=1 Tax=Flavobacterium lotistagni TaxID=2709660 RepID=UPI0014076D60|nr:hypothetical protein [Flavobacterium lotistagni]NHM06853.1 hypothetical protein [Flavobacterium lotistagni]